MKPLHWDAINPFTGTPFTWDDPNLKFINDIGMYLEPGDPGFVPYSASPAPKTKHKPRKYMASNPTPDPIGEWCCQCNWQYCQAHVWLYSIV